MNADDTKVSDALDHDLENYAENGPDPPVESQKKPDKHKKPVRRKKPDKQNKRKRPRPAKRVKRKPPSTSKPCWYFSKGRCRYGSRCKDYHRSSEPRAKRQKTQEELEKDRLYVAAQGFAKGLMSSFEH